MQGGIRLVDAAETLWHVVQTIEGAETVGRLMHAIDSIIAVSAPLFPHIALHHATLQWQTVDAQTL